MSAAGALAKACQWILWGTAVCPSIVEVTVKRTVEPVGEAACPPALADEQPAANIARARSQVQSLGGASLFGPSRFIGVSFAALPCDGDTPPPARNRMFPRGEP